MTEPVLCRSKTRALFGEEHTKKTKQNKGRTAIENKVTAGSGGEGCWFALVRRCLAISASSSQVKYRSLPRSPKVARRIYNVQYKQVYCISLGASRCGCAACFEHTLFTFHFSLFVCLSPKEAQIPHRCAQCCWVLRLWEFSD